MPAIVIATVWWSLGFAMILFLAGLQEIPAERYEAARLDGAGLWSIIRFITLPALSRTTTLVIVLQIILHFQVFGQSHLITRGGPNDATQVLVRYIYQTGFRNSELGYASALAVVLFLFMLVFAMLQLRVSRGDD
jgi:multiple sugar transport system permease protein